MPNCPINLKPVRQIFPDVLAWAAHRGLDIPGDLSLLGLSGHPEFLRQDPPITTLEDTRRRQAAAAFDLLDEFALRKSAQSRQKRVVPRLLEGRSVLPPGARVQVQ